MAYEKTVWVNGQAPALDADHLNKIEQGIADAVSITPQTLSDEQKKQARGNISALNGQFFFAAHVGGQSGWYRITEPFAIYSTSGYLTVSHAYANGGASELLLGVSSTPDTHGKLQCLRSVGRINSVPYISNARLVQIANTLALDLYISGEGINDWDLQLCNCGHNPITLTTPTFISADDTLPNGETLAAVMEYQNPPMLLGVEYKTTERYMGKPVYVKVVDCGHFAAAGTVKEIMVPDGNVEHMVGCTGRVGEWQIPATLFAGNPADAGDVRLEGRVDDSHHFYIYLYSKAYDLTTWQTIVTIKYTKTTD